MRRLLLLIVCTVPLAAAQTVLAIAPAPGPSGLVSMHAPMTTEAVFVSAPHAPGAGAAPVGSTAMLVAGLAGLTIAGGRRRERLQRPH
jgi:hypothetical protein